MATIGRREAVAALPGSRRFGGTVGWLAWLGGPRCSFVGFRNRRVVLIIRAWNYRARER